MTPTPYRATLATLAACAIAAVGGCIRAPDVVVVDRRTALEAEASGRFPELEAELQAAALDPRPLPMTRAMLHAAGWASPAETDAIATMTRSDDDERGRVDALLRRRCVGEARDGTLQPTTASCTGAVDAAEVNRLVERTNRARSQLWRWLATKAPGADATTVRSTWRKRHLLRVVCDAWVQRDDGSWQPKSCGSNDGP